jgi:excisionase family DNA binding protein
VTKGVVDLGTRLALTVPEAAQALGVSKRHLWACLAEIPHAHVGRRLLIPIEPLQSWLRERTQAPRRAAEPGQGDGQGQHTRARRGVTRKHSPVVHKAGAVDES